MPLNAVQLCLTEVWLQGAAETDLGQSPLGTLRRLNIKHCQTPIISRHE